MKKNLLRELESESISIIRDSFSVSNNPVFLYSIGKDSNVLLHLMKKSFYPSKIPIPLLHVDTKWKFKDMINFRDKIVKKMNLNLIIYTNPLSLKLHPQKNKNYTHVAKTIALRNILDKNKFDFIYGGARRDEETSRSKERIISLRESNHAWNPKNQRPELWQLYNFRKETHQSFRIFPLSNWTELDIWEYIRQENIELPSLYFSKNRLTIEEDGNYIMIDDNRLIIKNKKSVKKRKIRFRTLGCYPLTVGIRSNADKIDKIIAEIRREKTSERNGRLIDKESFYGMEKKKTQGYF